MRRNHLPLLQKKNILSSDSADGITGKRRSPPIFTNKNSIYSTGELLNTEIIKQKGK